MNFDLLSDILLFLFGGMYIEFIDYTQIKLLISHKVGGMVCNGYCRTFH